MCTIVDLVMGDTRKFFHNCNCIFMSTYHTRPLFFANIRTVRVRYSGSVTYSRSQQLIWYVMPCSWKVIRQLWQRFALPSTILKPQLTANMRHLKCRWPMAYRPFRSLGGVCLVCFCLPLLSVFVQSASFAFYHGYIKLATFQSCDLIPHVSLTF